MREAAELTGKTQRALERRVQAGNLRVYRVPVGKSFRVWTTRAWLAERGLLGEDAEHEFEFEFTEGPVPPAPPGIIRTPRRPEPAGDDAVLQELVREYAAEVERLRLEVARLRVELARRT